jgi:hypothetical protein
MLRRRRRKDAEAEAGQPATPAEHQAQAGQPAQPDGAITTTAGPVGKPDRPEGPFDLTEWPGDAARSGRTLIDLGGLKVPGVDGMQVQMQLDEQSGQGLSVIIGVGQAGIQIMAVAAAKSTPLWPSMIDSLAADAAARGGSTERTKGPFGEALKVTLPVVMADGRQGVQPSLMLGVDGPRWLLRASLLGAATKDRAARNLMLGLLRDCVVVRGAGPMAPGDVIALRPPEALLKASTAGDGTDGEDDLSDGDADLLEDDADLLEHDADLLEDDADLPEDDADLLEHDADLLEDDADLPEDDADRPADDAEAPAQDPEALAQDANLRADAADAPAASDAHLPDQATTPPDDSTGPSASGNDAGADRP